MTRVPNKLATLWLSNATEMRSTALAADRLNRTSTSMNFQNVATSGTSPTNRYTIAPKISGGTTRRGKMSKRIYTMQCSSSDSCMEERYYDKVD